jgi:glutamyl-tRNA reductase
MPFLAVGVEHKTAPLSVREAVALDATGIERVSLGLTAHSSETAVISTCNRTEIYLVADDLDAAARAAMAALDPSDRFGSYFQRWDDLDAAEHLFRLAAGLESQIVGEQQILGQVRETLETAQRLDTIGPNLHALFRSAISCARQARAGTAVGRVNLSVASEAVREAAGALGDLRGRPVLVVGGGEVSRLICEELRSRGAALYVANRTTSIAVDLAGRFGGRPATLADVPRLLSHVDLAISATGAPHHVVTVEDVPERETPLHIFDLAIPRDVEPAVGSLPAVTLHDLESLLPPEAQGWEEDIRSMEAIIAAEVKEFSAWILTRRVVPVISSLRSHVEAVSRQEMKRVAPHLADLSDRERAAVESLTQRLIDKMFHHLVTRLRLAAQTDPSLVDAAEFFFLHGEGGLFEHAAEAEVEAAPEPKP